MKTILAPLVFSIVAAICLGATPHASAQAQTPTRPKSETGSKPAGDSPKPGAQKPLPSDPEERFKALFTKATLSGRWAPLKNDELGDDRAGDNYKIVSVDKGTGDNWTVNATMKYGDREFNIPVPVQMKFLGDTTLLIVNNFSIPGGGTYSARLMIYERTYSGTWKGQGGGGMLYGTISNQTE